MSSANFIQNEPSVSKYYTVKMLSFEKNSSVSKALKNIVKGILLFIPLIFAALLDLGRLVYKSLIGKVSHPPTGKAQIVAQKIPLLLKRQFSKPISTEELWDILEQETQQNLSYLTEEQVNHRFHNILCPADTAVSVGTNYLHANWVGRDITSRLLIASQAPLKKDYEIFWKAIFENHATIFDLTTLSDQKKGVTKYYPSEVEETERYGSMQVKLLKKSENVHTYQIKDIQTKETKTITRVHYDCWKDFDAVSPKDLHQLAQLVKTLSPNPENLTWIHCRAGVGRTGTLTVALILKEQIQLGNITRENLENSLISLIILLRKQRGSYFVQQPVQLELLRNYAFFLLDLSSSEK